tara:strand:- start:655 stop:1179 length:525 start_codon:yes stop_codon:yes gene_type:complete
MKKITFLLVFISIFGYSQTIILASIQDRLPQEFLKINKTGNVNNKQPQSFQSEMLVQDGNYNLRLDRQIIVFFNNNGLSYKREYTYSANGNWTLYIRYNWNTDSDSFVPSLKSEYTYDENGNRTLDIYYDWDTNSQSFVPYYKNGTITYDENGNWTLYIYITVGTQKHNLLFQK